MKEGRGLPEMCLMHGNISDRCQSSSADPHRRLWKLPLCVSCLPCLISPGLSEDHSEGEYGPVPGRKSFQKNQPRILLSPFITWLLVKPLVENLWGYCQVSTAQGGPQHSIIGSFISALEGLLSQTVPKVRCSNWNLGSLVIYILSPNIWQYLQMPRTVILN